MIQFNLKYFLKFFFIAAEKITMNAEITVMFDADTGKDIYLLFLGKQLVFSSDSGTELLEMIFSTITVGFRESIDIALSPEQEKLLKSFKSN